MGVGAVARSLGLAAAVAVAALVGRSTVLEGTTVDLMWPAAGVAALWALLSDAWRTRVLDAALLVGVLVVVGLGTGLGLRLAVAFGLVELLQAGLFAALFTRWLGPGARRHGPLLLDLRGLGVLLASAAVATAAGAVLGTTASWLQTGIGSPLDLAVWQTRDVAAVLLVVPLGLRVRQLLLVRRGLLPAGIAAPSRWPSGWRSAELVLAVLATMLGNLTVFVLLPGYPIAFPLFALTAWVALRFDTAFTTVRDVAVSVVAVAATLAGTGPFAAIPDLGGRALVVQAYVLLGAVLGLALALSRDERTLLLVQVHRAAAEAGDHARQVQVLADASRGVLMAEDARTAVCQAVREVTGADGVYLLEPDPDGHYSSTTVLGLDMPPVRLRPDPEASLTARLFQTGGAVFAPDLFTTPGISRDLAEYMGISSAYWQSAQLGDDRVVAVIGLVWREPVAALPAATDRVLAVLGHEAAQAIERGNLLEQLARAADRDQLTGLANRRRWDELSAVEVSRAQRSRLPLTLMLLDLDHFKAYNDTRGHQAGDVLLQEFALTAQGCLRDGDLIARWGGEEFAVALPDCSDAEAQTVAARILAAVPHGQTATIGIAQWTREETAGQTLARADAALYRGKREGRARSVLADQPVGLPA